MVRFGRLRAAPAGAASPHPSPDLAGNSVWLAVARWLALIAVFGGLSTWRYRCAGGR